MQRHNRSAPAPRGAAFFLFLGLAIVPLSLRAAGVQVSFNPSLSAAADAWQQIADVFGSGYQPAREFTSSMPADQGIEPLRAFDSSACPNREFACAREVNELSATVEGASKVPVPQAGTTRRLCPRVALLKNIERQLVERSLAIPQSLTMLVRVKSPAIPSATKAAQCKVRAALDSVRRVERERAILTSLSSASPDNCEL